MESLVSSFLEIAVGHSADTARRFLEAAGGELDDALALFFENGGWEQQPPLTPSHDFGGGSARPSPPPVEDLWGSSSSNYGRSSPEDNGGNRATDLAALYRPPFELMYFGSFESSKDEAKKQGKWLLVNVQSAGEFASHVLNRDTWADESVANIIKSTFVFWQYDYDTYEGQKVCTYYNLTSMPAVLVIDPITGRSMRSWTGAVQTDTFLLEGLQPFLDQTPSDYLASYCNKHRAEIKAKEGFVEAEEEEEKEEGAAMEIEKGTKKEDDDAMHYPDLPEEPLMADANLVCRVRIQLPDGRRLQRKFLRSDPIQLLWSFCHSHVGETDRTKPFRLTPAAAPEASKVVLEYETKLSFEESGVVNSMIRLTWD